MQPLILSCYRLSHLGNGTSHIYRCSNFTVISLCDTVVYRNLHPRLKHMNMLMHVYRLGFYILEIKIFISLILIAPLETNYNNGLGSWLDIWVIKKDRQNRPRFFKIIFHANWNELPLMCEYCMVRYNFRSSAFFRLFIFPPN